jgi:hypothetical protein
MHVPCMPAARRVCERRRLLHCRPAASSYANAAGEYNQKVE